jgi:hypothetical protein
MVMFSDLLVNGPDRLLFPFVIRRYLTLLVRPGKKVKVGEVRPCCRLVWKCDTVQDER